MEQEKNLNFNTIKQRTPKKKKKIEVALNLRYHFQITFNQSLSF